MDELITNPPEIHIAGREPPSEYDYLGTDHMIKPKGDYPIMEAHSVSVDDRMVDEVLADLQQAQSSFDSQISGLDSRVTDLEESKGTVVKIKGRVNTVNDLPNNADVGDLYFVGPASSESFEEYVYTDQKRWEYLGSINDVDLSDYVTKTFLSNQLLGYAKLSDIPTVPTNYLTGGSQTSKSTADGGKNVYTFTKSDGTTSTLEVLNGTKGSKGDTGPQGEQGIQGIQGPQGLKGDTGAKGDKGDTGATGPAGKDGTNGSNGVSCTHSWSGTTLTVTSASGTSSANLKGAKGDKGDTGSTGPQGPKGDTGPAGQNATTTATATQSANGLMSADDKKKLDGVAAGATAVTTSTVSGWGYTKNAGTVTSVKVGSTAYNPSSGVVSLPSFPTTLPANGGISDVAKKVLTQSHTDWYMDSRYDNTYFQLKARHDESDGTYSIKSVNVGRSDVAGSLEGIKTWTETTLSFGGTISGYISASESSIKERYNAVLGRVMLVVKIKLSKALPVTAIGLATASSGKVPISDITFTKDAFRIYQLGGNRSISIQILKQMNVGDQINAQIEYTL